MIKKDEIIRRAKEVHGDKYNYSLVEDSQNVLTKIKIVCKTHGVFEQTIHNHLQGKGCKQCYKEKGRKTRFTKEQFIDYVKNTHDDLENYDFANLPEKFDLSHYVNLISLVCKRHGEFKIRYIDFLNGDTCPYCSGKLKTDEQIRKELSILHPELDFSMTNFSEHDEKYRVTVRCPKHGLNSVKYYNLIYGQGGCPECGNEKMREKERITKEEFIKKASNVHGNKYDYSKVNYVNARTKVEIICPKHGSFFVMPTNFTDKKSGCPICNNSHLEDEMSRFLNENNIKYIPQKTCKWLGLQKLDFYLPEYNVAIECHGIQHFKHTGYSFTSVISPEEAFVYYVTNDIKKNERCRENNLPLFYFTYKENFKEEYYDNETYGSIYHKSNVFFNKENLLEYIKKLKV